MDFLFGLDNLKRHQCCIDLAKNELRIGSCNAAVPFLAESEIPKRFLADADELAAQGPSAAVAPPQPRPAGTAAAGPAQTVAAPAPRPAAAAAPAPGPAAGSQASSSSPNSRQRHRARRGPLSAPLSASADPRGPDPAARGLGLLQGAGGSGVAEDQRERGCRSQPAVWRLFVTIAPPPGARAA